MLVSSFLLTVIFPTSRISTRRRGTSSRLWCSSPSSKPCMWWTSSSTSLGIYAQLILLMTTTAFTSPGAVSASCLRRIRSRASIWECTLHRHRLVTLPSPLSLAWQGMCFSAPPTTKRTRSAAVGGDARFGGGRWSTSRPHTRPRMERSTRACWFAVDGGAGQDTRIT